jgi:quercetin dioxygenase-like cupin family protein
MNVFPLSTQALFAANYPEVPHKLEHNLATHPLLELDALARLAKRLAPEFIECNLGDQPLGVDRVPEQLRERVVETIQEIDTAGCWVCLRNVEQQPEYADLLGKLLEEMRPQIERKTGPMMNLRGFIFVTSPGGVVPYHFDPEHNILLQLRGSKVMTVFAPGDPAFAADEAHEAFYAGGRPELKWRDEMAPQGIPITIGPGEAVYVPVKAPHHVTNGAEVSVSISVTWQSPWSFAEADARAFNAMLRRIGIKPSPPGRWPRRNLVKAYSWRTLRNVSFRPIATAIHASCYLRNQPF